MGFTFPPRPTLEQAHRWRYWLLITTALESTLFSAYIYGWTSLFFMLKSEGFYDYMCLDDHGNTTGNYTFGAGNGAAEAEVAPEVEPEGFEASHAEGGHGDAAMRRLLGGAAMPDEQSFGCSEQDKMMNLIYTSCLFALTGSSMFIGYAQDQYGYRPTRLIASVLFTLSSALMIFSHKDASHILIPGLLLLGIGGITFSFTAVQMANLFPRARSAVLGLLIGSMGTSAIMCTVFKVLYDRGMSWKTMWIILTGGGVWVLLNCFFTWPVQSIPEPHEMKARATIEKLSMTVAKGEVQDFDKLKMIGSKLGEKKTSPFMNIMTSRADLTHRHQGPVYETMGQVACSPLFLLGLYFVTFIMLRVFLYLGTLHLYLLKLAPDYDTASSYVDYFGYIQVICIIVCPLMNMIIDVGQSTGPDDETEEEKEERDFKQSVTKMNNCNLCIVANQVILMIFGIMLIIPILQLHLIAFVAHTVMRVACIGAVLGIFAVIFPFNLIGKLMGLAIVTGAVVDIIQMPMFRLIEGTLEGEPFIVDVILLVCSLINLIMPLYLIYYVWLMKKMYAENLKMNKNVVKKMIKYGDPYAIKHFSDKAHEEAFC